MKSIVFCFVLLISGCVGIPAGIHVVDNFDAHRYLGKWYEIARLDHSFERGLDNITAIYSKRDDGGLRVLNSGIDTTTGKLKTAEGKAYFTGSASSGSLKVSFLGLFTVVTTFLNWIMITTVMQ